MMRIGRSTTRKFMLKTPSRLHYMVDDFDGSVHKIGTKGHSLCVHPDDNVFLSTKKWVHFGDDGYFFKYGPKKPLSNFWFSTENNRLLWLHENGYSIDKYL